MNIKYESSFLSDLQRIDNTIEVCHYRYNIGDLITTAKTIYDSEKKKLRIWTEDEVDKSSVGTVEFYYRLKGVWDDFRLAFTIENASNLDPVRNLYELSMDTEVVLSEEKKMVPTVYQGSYLETLGLGDTVTVLVGWTSRLTAGTFTIKTLGGRILAQSVARQEEISFTPEQEDLDIIHSRGIRIETTGTGTYTKKLVIRYENPVKANIECPNLGDNEKFLLGPGIDYGTSLYKNNTISESSVVWKDFYYRYVSTEGLGEHGNSKLLESKSGKLITAPRYIRSYSNLTTFIQGMTVDGIYETSTVIKPKPFYLTTGEYYAWTSPLYMVELEEKKDVELVDDEEEAVIIPTTRPRRVPRKPGTIPAEETQEVIDYTPEIDDETEPTCEMKTDVFLNPGDVIYGNPDTDCLQYASLAEKVVGLRLYGIPGSVVEARFNRKSKSGEYDVVTGTHDENGICNLDISGLEAKHLNNIVAVSGNIVSRIYKMVETEEEESEFVPTGEDLFLKEVSSKTSSVSFYGSCNYIEYEIFDGKITKHSEGTMALESIPGLEFEVTEHEQLVYRINLQTKSIDLSPTYTTGVAPSAIFQAVVKNNYQVDPETGDITTTELYSDTRVRVRQRLSDSTFWRFRYSFDYYEGTRPVAVCWSGIGESRYLSIETNYDISDDPNLEKLTIDYTNTDTIITTPEGGGSFDIVRNGGVTSRVDEEAGTIYTIQYRAVSKQENTDITWHPKKLDTENPGLLSFAYDGVVLSGCQVYVVQRPPFKDLEIWDCVTGNEYSSAYYDDDEEYQIVLDGSSTSRRFIVATKDPDIVEEQHWYVREKEEMTGSTFSIRSSTSSTEEKVMGTLIHYDGTPETIKSEGSEYRAFFFSSDTPSTKAYLGAVEISTASATDGWRKNICASTIELYGYKEPTASRFVISRIVQPGISVQTIDISSTYKFKAVCEDGSGIFFVDDEGNTDIQEMFFTNEDDVDIAVDTETDTYYRIYNYQMRVAVKSWPYPGSNSSQVIRIYNSNSTDETPTTYIGINTNNPILSQSYVDTNTAEQRRLIFLENNPSAISSGDITLKFTTNYTPVLTASIRNSLSTVTYGSNFDGGQYNYSTATFQLSSVGSIYYNRYYPLSTQYNTLTLNQNLHGLTFRAYVKGLDHQLWGSPVDNNAANPMSDAINNETQTVKVYLGSNIGYEKTLRVFSRYNMAEGSIFEYVDSAANIDNEVLKSTMPEGGWTSVGVTDNINYTRYYKDYKFKTVQANLEGQRRLATIRIYADTVYIGKNKTSVISELIGNANTLVNNELQVNGELNVNYINNNILPAGRKTLKVEIWQFGTDDDSLSLGELDTFGVTGGTNNVPVNKGSKVKVLSEGTEVTNIVPEGCTVNKSISNYQLTLSATMPPRFNAENPGRWSDDWSTLKGYQSSKNINFDVKVNYLNSLEQQTSYEKNVESSQDGYTKGLVIQKSGDSKVYVGIGLGGNNESSTITYEGINPDSPSLVEFMLGVVDLDTNGPVLRSIMVEPGYKWTGSDVPFTAFTPDVPYGSSNNFGIQFSARIPGEAGNKEYILSLSDTNTDFDTSNLKVKFIQGPQEYRLTFDNNNIGILSDGTVYDNEGYITFTTNLQPERIQDLQFISEEIGIVNWDTIEAIENGYKVKLWFKPNGTGAQRTGTIKAKYAGKELGSSGLIQGHFSFQLTPYWATYTLSEKPRTEVYPEFDLARFEPTSKDSEKMSYTPKPVNNDPPLLVVTGNDEDYGIVLDLVSEMRGSNLYLKTRQSVILKTVITYIKGEEEEAATVLTHLDPEATTERLITLDNEKVIDKIEILVPKDEERTTPVSVNFEALVLDYVPPLKLEDFVLTSGSEEGVTWTDKILYVPDDKVGVITLSDISQNYEYKGERLKIKTTGDSLFRTTITYTDTTSLHVDGKSESEHIFTLDPTKILSSIAIEGQPGTTIFEELSLYYVRPDLDLSGFVADGEEVTWQDGVLETTDLTKGISINLGQHSEYKGHYNPSRLLIVTEDEEILKVVVSYLGGAEDTIYTDSIATRYHWVEIHQLVNILGVSIYPMVVNDPAHLLGISIDPLEYVPAIVGQTDLENNPYRFYASTDEQEVVKAIGSYSVPCRTEKDNGLSIIEVPRKVFIGRLFRQEINDNEPVSLWEEGLVSGNWSVSRVIWKNEGKTDISEYFNSYGGVLVNYASGWLEGNVFKEDYIYSNHLPYFEDTYETKADFIGTSVTATTTFEVTIKNTNSELNYQHLGESGIVNFRFSYDIEKVAESVNETV